MPVEPLADPALPLDPETCAVLPVEPLALPALPLEPETCAVLPVEPLALPALPLEPETWLVLPVLLMLPLLFVDEPDAVEPAVGADVLSPPGVVLSSPLPPLCKSPLVSELFSTNSLWWPVVVMAPALAPDLPLLLLFLPEPLSLPAPFALAIVCVCVELLLDELALELACVSLLEPALELACVSLPELALVFEPESGALWLPPPALLEEGELAA